MKDVWVKILNDLLKGSKELPTTPKTNKAPVWFLASTDGEKIYINEAVENKPSSNLKSRRVLTYKNFEDIYPIHLRRESGEKVSKEATDATRNQVYYFSLINHLGK